MEVTYLYGVMRGKCAKCGFPLTKKAYVVRLDESKSHRLCVRCHGIVKSKAAEFFAREMKQFLEV